MKTSLLSAAMAAGALCAAAAVAPAMAQSRLSVGVGVTMGGGYAGGYPGAYYGGPRHRSYPDAYAYSRAARSACFRDPVCSGYGYGHPGLWAAPVYAPPPVMVPPVVVYERRDSYDPLPHWREMAPQDRIYASPPPGQGTVYTNDLYGAYGQQPAPEFRGDVPYDVAMDAPPTQNGAVRFDLARRGYTAEDFGAPVPLHAAPYSLPPVSLTPEPLPPLDDGWGDPNALLLGGPRQ